MNVLWEHNEYNPCKRDEEMFCFPVSVAMCFFPDLEEYSWHSVSRNNNFDKEVDKISSYLPHKIYWEHTFSFLRKTYQNQI
jgi:hypothetical protein